jgi:RHS repeat-associated protein
MTASNSPSKSSLNRVGIRNSTDYSPFGVELDSRTVSLEGYRFGFNGKENLNEISGGGNEYDFGARIYNPRIGRWLSRDAHEAKYPSNTPYDYVINNPITSIDPDGKDVIILIWYTSKGNIGHTALAVENYRQKRNELGELMFTEIMGDNNEIIKTPVMEKTGSYQYYDFWPANEVKFGNHQSPVNSDFNTREIESINELTNKDPSISGEYEHLSANGEGGKAPDIAFRIHTTEEQDKTVSEKAKSFEGKKYNACSFNCTTFAIESIKFLLPEKIGNNIGSENIIVSDYLNVTYDYQNAVVKTPNGTNYSLMMLTKPTEDLKKKYPNLVKITLEKAPATPASKSDYIRTVKGY